MPYKHALTMVPTKSNWLPRRPLLRMHLRHIHKWIVAKGWDCQSSKKGAHLYLCFFWCLVGVRFFLLFSPLALSFFVSCELTIFIGILEHFQVRLVGSLVARGPQFHRHKLILGLFDSRWRLVDKYTQIGLGLTIGYRVKGWGFARISFSHRWHLGYFLLWI